ncbi:hypothetical protein E7T06_05440 [Deinococcus sp. Arct2-2]|uniref:hypothetical protein n=1 Tax=Deinococcus sp. Arct2-2 TaxID=2568653 RepID=UPI0010A4DCF8|nr:hypothetical protein [Deinococcus sp. Arct2-2]THF70796.1 hypothetical protein E7T06_05440 [Deinococcus sp. Arct2-2]
MSEVASSARQYSSPPGSEKQPQPGRVLLSPHETHPAHAFADPDHSAADLHDLRQMQARLRLTLRRVSADDGQVDRIYDPQGLRTLTGLTVVGFRGLCRPDISTALQEEVTRVDTALGAQLERDQSRMILGYSTRQLGPHDWLNLVVLRNEAGLHYWHQSALHRYAAQELSPQLYQGIRLHTGKLPQGLRGPLHLSVTKYYALGSAPWQAQRNYGGNASRSGQQGVGASGSP